jgi:hypothetical protein
MLKQFKSTNPELEDYEIKLREFQNFEDNVGLIPVFHQIGALMLKTESLKSGLKNWIAQWKEGYSQDLHKKARSQLEHLIDDIKQIRLRVEK